MSVTRAQAAPPSPVSSTPRDPTFDILKGIGILEVIIHHVTAHSARKYAVAADAHWWSLMVVNRVLHFAVPVFLLASALLLARSVARRPKPNWRRFFSRRLERSVWPYVIWSGFYWVFRVLFNRIGSDIYPTPVSIGGATFTLPGLFAHPEWMLRDLFWGKAYYHLYFMVVLIQFSLLFPLFYYAMRRWRPAFAGALLGAVGLQALAFLAQAQWWRLPYPASTILWYLPPVVVGMWLGLNWEDWPRAWARWWPAMVAMTVLGGGVYLALAFRDLAGLRIHGFSFNASVQLYTLGMALLLLRWAQTLVGGGLGRFLAAVGDKSLPLFLMHPAVLYLLSGPKISGLIGSLPLSVLWVLLLALAVTWGLIYATARLRLDTLLFGRHFEPSSFRLGRKPAGA